MATARTALEMKLLRTLRRIAAYATPARLQKHSGDDYGLPYEEALEMAYENMQAEAKGAIKGVRTLPAPPPVAATTGVG